MTALHCSAVAALATLLATGLLVPSATFAQDTGIGPVRDRASPARSRPVPPRTPIKPRGPVEDLMALPQPRYVVEAVSFHAFLETPPEDLGSDEVYAVFYDPGRDVAVVTSVEDDVDSGETHTFRRGQKCIAPIGDRRYDPDIWSCGPGLAAPLSFEIALFEHDEPSEHVCLLEPLLSNSTNAHGLVEEGLCSVVDTRIGYASVQLTLADLEGWLRRPGDSFSRDVDMGWGCPDIPLCAFPAHYSVRYRIRRVADYTPEQPLVAGRR